MNENVELRYVGLWVKPTPVWFTANTQAVDWLASEGIEPDVLKPSTKTITGDVLTPDWLGFDDGPMLTRLFDATRDHVLDYVRDEVDRAVRDAETVAV